MALPCRVATLLESQETSAYCQSFPEAFRQSEQPKSVFSYRCSVSGRVVYRPQQTQLLDYRLQGFPTWLFDYAHHTLRAVANIPIIDRRIPVPDYELL